MPLSVLSSMPFAKGTPDGFPKLYSGALPQTPHSPCGRGAGAPVPCLRVCSVSLCQGAFTAYPRRISPAPVFHALLDCVPAPLSMLTLPHRCSLPIYRWKKRQGLEQRNNKEFQGVTYKYLNFLLWQRLEKLD